MAVPQAELGSAGQLEARAKKTQLPAHGSCERALPEIVVINFEVMNAFAQCPKICGASFIMSPSDVGWKESPLRQPHRTHGTL